MIESKRFPREFILANPKITTKSARHRPGETPEQFQARCKECKRLRGVLLGLEDSLKRNSIRMKQIFSNRDALQRELKRLYEDQEFWKKIDAVFQGISLLLSVGTASVVKAALSKAFGVVGTIIGLPTSTQRIRTILQDIAAKTNKYQELQENHKKFLQDISKVYQPYRKMECRPTVARRF